MKKWDCILLIDDDYICNLLNEILIKNLSLFNTIEIAANGVEGLERLLNLSAQGIYPNLILLDINMPTMDGFEFLKTYHLNHTNKCPVVMLSAAPNFMDLEKAKFLQVDDYMIKPLTKDKLKKIIEKHCNSMKQV